MEGVTSKIAGLPKIVDFHSLDNLRDSRMEDHYVAAALLIALGRSGGKDGIAGEQRNLDSTDSIWVIIFLGLGGDGRRHRGIKDKTGKARA